MGYARHIGRVGALAVTLGVGVAIATTPGISYASPSGSSTSSDSSSGTSSSGTSSSGTSSSGTSSRTSSSGTDRPSTSGTDGASTNGTDGTDGTDPSDSTDDSSEGTETPADDTADEDTAADEDAEEVDDADDPTPGGLDEDTPPGAGDEGTPPVETPEEDDVVPESASGDSAAQQLASETDGVRSFARSDVSDQVDSTDDEAAGASTESDGRQVQTFSIVSEDEGSGTQSFMRTMAATTTMAAVTTAPAPRPRPRLVSIISDFVSNLVAAVLNPLMGSGDGSPIQMPILSAVLAAVREEFQRSMTRRTAPAASQYTVTQLTGPKDKPPADPTPNVLVIGVDGTNLSRILADPENDNFFALMDESTTAASSIVGHTTISNPSWTAVLTGVWGERTGVINNVFTPWTYDKFPTVFNQLETLNPDIDTTVIADWNVINAISGAGSLPADLNIYVPQIEGDTYWDETDDAVGDAVVDAIANTDAATPSFLFSYFVGVDENGHMFGGASPEYAAAINNVDDNLGEIMATIDAWETAHPGEEWTIIVVTDHGHQPQKGFGHGFQSPDETATFVIARGPDFEDGWVNPEYEIVDTTPTVVTLFGGTPLAGSDGVSLTTLGDSDEDPADLHQALEDMIATNQSPDIITTVALSLRTIFATIPYLIYGFTVDSTGPIKIVGDVLYVATNVPAQIVAFLTGVTGARIFPILPPPPPSWPNSPEEAGPAVTTILVCGVPGAVAGSCGDAIVA